MTFAELPLSAQLQANLAKANFVVPTAVQQAVLTPALEGNNIVATAHTGTGKTYAFAIPIIERLQKTDGIAIIVVPTRELATQLDRAITKLTRGIPHMNPSVLISGVPLERQIDSLKTKPRIIIATPGRLTEHMIARSFAIASVKISVLDEADHLLNSGFAPQIERILDRTSRERQTMMFSATMPAALSRLILRYAPDPTDINLIPEQAETSLITHQACLIGPTRRVALLTKLIHETTGPVIVFTATKRAAQRLDQELLTTSLSFGALHGDRTRAARTEIITGFRKHQLQVLLATDVAGRGIDIPSVALVVNYDLPHDAHTYTHRAGRTGRAGKEGRVVSFITPPDVPHMRRLANELSLTFEVIEKSS
jgi:superfamily II DNA/RNA helicase